MGTLLRETPRNKSQWISLHDKVMSEIVIEADSVQFCFRDGFDLIDDGQLKTLTDGTMVINGCSEDDINCYIIESVASERGLRFQGREFRLNELATLLRQEHAAIEVYKEIYDENTIHLRGEWLPYGQYRHWKSVVIETAGWFPIRYGWDEQ